MKKRTKATNKKTNDKTGSCDAVSQKDIKILYCNDGQDWHLTLKWLQSLSADAADRKQNAIRVYCLPPPSPKKTLRNG